MKYYELREKIIEGIEEEYGSLDKCSDPGFEAGVNAALHALSDVMENDDYVNWDDIRDALKSHLNDEILCEMFNPEDVL